MPADSCISVNRLPPEGIIGKFHRAPLLRYVPLVLLTTVAVVVVPFVTVAILRAQGLIGGVIPLAGAGLAISFAISALGSMLWKASPASGDLLFGDLLVWGFIRRWMVDRRLSSAVGLLGLRGERKGAKLPRERQAELLERLGNSLEARDPYTHGHSRRVARHAATMAKQMGLPKHEVARIRTAAAIHDVGKVKTPAEVLSKPGKLSDKEYAAIKRHPVDGARMVERLRDPKLTKMVLHHHERLDGGGYPRGLRGERIPLGARIIAVADTFDAITSARPYRSAKSHRKGLDVLRTEAGTQLDPDAVEAFRSYYSGMKPVAIWAVLANLPQRLFTGLFDELGASVASASKTAAMTAATAASVVAGAAAIYAAGVSGGPAAGPDTAQAATVSDPGALSAMTGLPGLEHQVDQSKSLARDGHLPFATMAKLDERGGKSTGDGLVAGSTGGGAPDSTARGGSGGGSAGATSADDGGSAGGGGPTGGEVPTAGNEGKAGSSPSHGDTGSGSDAGSGSDHPGAGGGNPTSGGGNPTSGGGNPTTTTTGNSHGGGSGSDNPNAHGGNPNAGGGNAGGGGSGNPNAGGGNPNSGGGNSQGNGSSGPSESSGSTVSTDSAGPSPSSGSGSSANSGEAPGHNKH